MLCVHTWSILRPWRDIKWFYRELEAAPVIRQQVIALMSCGPAAACSGPGLGDVIPRGWQPSLSFCFQYPGLLPMWFPACVSQPFHSPA